MKQFSYKGTMPVFIVITGLLEIELLELTVVFPTDLCAWHKLLWLFGIR